jgi:hypothetical protein
MLKERYANRKHMHTIFKAWDMKNEGFVTPDDIKGMLG